MSVKNEIVLTRHEIFLMIEEISNAKVSEKIEAIEKALRLKTNASFKLSVES